MLTQVRTAFCDSCMEITVQSNGGAQEHQPNRFSTILRTKNQVKLIRYPNKGEWGSAQQVFNSFENKHVNYRNIPLFQKRISHKINDFLLKARPVHKRTLLRINISNSIVSIQELKINDFLLKARHVQKIYGSL